MYSTNTYRVPDMVLSVRNCVGYFLFAFFPLFSLYYVPQMADHYTWPYLRFWFRLDSGGTAIDWRLGGKRAKRSFLMLLPVRPLFGVPILLYGGHGPIRHLASPKFTAFTDCDNHLLSLPFWSKDSRGHLLLLAYRWLTISCWFLLLQDSS